jgi:hypothetical protein
VVQERVRAGLRRAKDEHSIAFKVAMKRAVLYLRVSTVDQTTANQERELREVAETVRKQRPNIGLVDHYKIWSASYPSCMRSMSIYAVGIGVQIRSSTEQQPFRRRRVRHK